MFLLVIPGHHNEEVADVEEASKVYARVRDESSEGASTFPSGSLIGGYGRTVYAITYNAKVWPARQRRAGDQPVYDPYAKGAAA